MPRALLEEVHLGFAEIEDIIFSIQVQVPISLYMLGAIVLLAFALAAVRFLLLNWFAAGKIMLASDIFGNKEVVLVLLLLLRFLQITTEAHLLMVRRGENFLRLSFHSQLLRENLTFDVHIWLDVRNGQRDSLSHHLSIQILPLNVFL